MHCQVKCTVVSNTLVLVLSFYRIKICTMPLSRTRILDGFLLAVLVQGWILSSVDADVRSKIFCDGDAIGLRCPKNTVLSVFGVFYRVLEPSSIICKHVNTTTSICHPNQISRVVRTSCQGKPKCSLSSRPVGQGDTDCLKALYLTVWYDCGPVKVYTEADGEGKIKKSIDGKEKWGLTTQSVGVTFATRRPLSKSPSAFPSERNKELSYFSFFFWTLFSAALAYDYIQARPRHVILCVILSASAGIVILIVAVLFMACYQKIKEEKDEEAESDMDISAPIVSNGKETGDIEGKEHTPLIPSTRQKVTRTNSVNEGTQTDRETEVCIDRETEIVDGRSKEQTLSEKEAKELGHLVEIMRFYNSKLSASQHSLPQLKDVANVQRARQDAHEARTGGVKKSYTLPRRTSGDELDELFQQLSNMSPKRQQYEIFDNCPRAGGVGHYENLNGPAFLTSTPLPQSNEILDRQRGSNRSWGRGEEIGIEMDNLPANHAYLGTSASALLKELNGNHDSDFFSSRSSSQMSEYQTPNDDSKFVTFRSGRGGTPGGSNAGGGANGGTLDRTRRYDEGSLQRNTPRDNAGRGLQQDTPEITVLSSGLVRNKSDVGSNYRPHVSNFGTLGPTRFHARSEVPMNLPNSRSNTLTHAGSSSRDPKKFQYAPANSDRVRILKQEM